MNSITKQDLENFVGRFERAAAASRGSLSPAIIAEWDKNIKQIPLLADKLETVKLDSDKVDGIITKVAVIETVQARHTATIDNVFRWIWGLVTGVIMLGFGILFK